MSIKLRDMNCSAFERTFAALGVISSVMSLPSSSCWGLYTAWVYALLLVWANGFGIAVGVAALPNSVSLGIRHPTVDWILPFRVPVVVSALRTRTELLWRKVLLGTAERPRGRRNSRTGSEPRFGASCTNSFAADSEFEQPSGDANGAIVSVCWS